MTYIIFHRQRLKYNSRPMNNLALSELYLLGQKSEQRKFLSEAAELFSNFFMDIMSGYMIINILFPKQN